MSPEESPSSPVVKQRPTHSAGSPMRKAIEVKHYPIDRTVYIRYGESEPGGHTEEIGPELQGPTYVTRNTDGKRFSWLPKRQFEIIVDYDSDGGVSGIEIIRNTESARKFLEGWCKERGLEFPEI